MSRGMSSRDVLLEGAAFDLTKEYGLLAAMEQSVLELTHAARVTGRNATVRLGGGHSIDPTARLLGPVVIHPNVRIDAHATIVGPALIGEGSHVSAGTVVAHALLGTQSRVLQGTVVRDRVWSAGVEDDACDVVERPSPPARTDGPIQGRVVREAWQDTRRGSQPPVPGVEASIRRGVRRGGPHRVVAALRDRQRARLARVGGAGVLHR